MSLKYPDIHKKREHRLTEHSRALITKIIRTEPSRNEGNDGDIIFGNTSSPSLISVAEAALEVMREGSVLDIKEGLTSPNCKFVIGTLSFLINFSY